MKEVWKNIMDFNGYQVSNLGRIRSLKTYKVLKQKIYKGYKSLCLFKCGKIYSRSVHRLVAEAFIPNPKNLPCVNHKDENKTNNCVNNLEWCDYTYNVNYGTGINRMLETRRKNSGHTVLNVNLTELKAHRYVKT